MFQGISNCTATVARAFSLPNPILASWKLALHVEVKACDCGRRREESVRICKAELTPYVVSYIHHAQAKACGYHQRTKRGAILNRSRTLAAADSAGANTFRV